MIIKKKVSLIIVLILLLPTLFIAIALGYLYKERYLACITQNFLLCIQSKKYVSANGKYIFRYPAGYPLTYKTHNQLINEYNFDSKYDEWVNFSNDFYRNAGGERLGSVIVIRNTPFRDIKDYVSKELSNFEVPPILSYKNIGGKAAVCSSLKQQPQSFSNPSYDCYIIDNNQLYIISFDYNEYYHKLPIEYYQAARQLILSTFMFY